MFYLQFFFFRLDIYVLNLFSLINTFCYDKVEAILSFLSWSFVVDNGDQLRSKITCSPFWGSFSVWESFTVGDQLQYSVLYTRQIFIRRELKHRHWDLLSETEAFNQVRHRTSGCCSCQRSPSLTVAGPHYPCSIICVPLVVNDSFSSSNFPDKVKPCF